ncbi:Serine/threonine-protein kinase PK-1 [subsurface metagenome]|nr:PASTA domain-containing protein [Clostridia bacterium]
MRGGAKIFFIPFFTSIFVSAAVCFLFFVYGIPFLERVEVPDVRRATIDQGRLIMENRSLFLLVESETEDPSIPEGSIINQSPLPGSLVKKGTPISVVLSKGKGGIALPNFSSVPLEEARRILAEMRLKIGSITERSSVSVAKGSIISTFPSPDSIVKEGTIIDLVLGRRLGQAKEILERAGLRVGRIDYVCDIEKLFDIILRQNPRPGKNVPKSTVVNLTINTEEEE